MSTRSNIDEFDLVVIGAGSGGLVAAIGGQKLGLKTALIEGRLFGGDCLNFGCVPSKSLIHSARAAHTMRTAEKYAIQPVEPQFNWPDVTARIASIQDTIREHETADYFRRMGMTVYETFASFIDPHTLQVGDARIRARYVVIATGGSPLAPPIEGLAEAGFITNEEVFTISEQPRRLGVIGGGPIGIELAQAFARLGTTVTVIEAGGSILGREDEDMSSVVHRTLEEEGVTFRLDSKAQRITIDEDGKRIELQVNGNGDGQPRHDSVRVDEILIAAGRKPNLDNLNLDAAGVASDKRGISVNRRMRTTQKHIYAVGDCTDGFLFTHAASLEAGVALRNIVFRLPAKVNYDAFGWCTYTEPELASVGLNEQRAREKGIDYRVAEAGFRDNDRALTESATAGKIKVLYRPGRFRKRVIGAQIVGPHAGELIHEYVLAISRGVTISQMAAPTHIYPTLSEINRRAALDTLTKSLFTDRTRKILRLLFRYRGAVSQKSA